MDRPLIGGGVRVAKIETTDLPCLLLQRVARVQPGSKLNVEFLFALLSSNMFIAHFEPDTTGVSVPHISPEQIADFIIPIPQMDEQEAIVAHIASENSRIDALTIAGKRAIDLLQERRSALISAAVTGKIDVRNYVPKEVA